MRQPNAGTHTHSYIDKRTLQYPHRLAITGANVAAKRSQCRMWPTNEGRQQQQEEQEKAAG